MDAATIAALKEDFTEWSGGFAPESLDQITVYIDYAISTEHDPTDARRVLIAWMNEEANRNAVEPHR